MTITGTGFKVRPPGSPGGPDSASMTVTLGDIALAGYVVSSTTAVFLAPAHGAATVDVVVTNMDGQADRLAGGYTYAPPESFDFNGNWLGDAYSEGAETEMRFTIHNNTLTSATCGSATVTFSPPPLVSNGEFAFFPFGNDGVGISGRIVSPFSAVGKINMSPCTLVPDTPTTTAWRATRQ